METITIPKKEYKILVSKAKAYEKIAKNVYRNKIHDPVDKVVEDFQKTGIYSNDFIKDLESGLRKSTYAGKKK